MRRLVYYIAITADGFIALADGSFGVFLQSGEHMGDLFALLPETVPGHLREAVGVSGPNRRFDTVLMGRRTYQVGLDLGVTSPYPHLRQIVFSRTLSTSPDAAVTLVSGDPLPAVEGLKGEDGRDIWLCGGGELAAAVAPAIDEIILKVNPVVIGAGTPLFARGIEPRRLALVHSRQYANGFALLHYSALSAVDGSR
jgi:dihydrofolate reductase